MELERRGSRFARCSSPVPRAHLRSELDPGALTAEAGPTASLSSQGLLHSHSSRQPTSIFGGIGFVN